MVLFEGVLLFYVYKQLYVINYLFFDNIAIVSRMPLLFTASENIAQYSPVGNRVYGYLRLSFEVRVLATYLIYYHLNFLSTCLLQLKHER